MDRARKHRGVDHQDGSEAMPVVHIEPVDEEARQLWDAAIALADELPARGWALVGGLMVQLHAYRHGQAGVRATVDIDILADSRQQPRSLTEVVAQRLLELKFEVAQHTGLVGPPTVHRFERGGEVVDVLGPDGMKGQPPRTVANNETIQVPAGTQALARTERVQVRVLGGRVGVLRCPSLTAALLLKSRAIRIVHRDQDRQDLVVLLSCVDDPFDVKQQLTKKQLDWLQKAAVRLRIEEPDLSDLFAREQLARARAAYRLLTVG